MHNSLYDKNMQLSILKGMLEDALNLIETKKSNSLKLPTFRSAIVEQKSDVTYKLIQSPFELLTDIQKDEWLHYAKIRSDIHFKETLMSNFVDESAELVFILLVFEQDGKIIFAAKSINYDVEDYICEVYKKDIKNKTITMNTSWENTNELDFLKGSYLEPLYFH